MASREETKSNGIKTKEEEEMIEAAQTLVCLSRAVITESENIATEEISQEGASVEAVEDIVAETEVVVAEEESCIAQEEVTVAVEATVIAEEEVISEEDSTNSSYDYDTYSDSDSEEYDGYLDNAYTENYANGEEIRNGEWYPDFNVGDYIDPDSFEYWVDGERLTLEEVLETVHDHTCATNYVDIVTLVVGLLSGMFLVQRIYLMLFLLTSK